MKLCSRLVQQAHTSQHRQTHRCLLARWIACEALQLKRCQSHCIAAGCHCRCLHSALTGSHSSIAGPCWGAAPGAAEPWLPCRRHHGSLGQARCCRVQAVPDARQHLVWILARLHARAGKQPDCACTCHLGRILLTIQRTLSIRPASKLQALEKIVTAAFRVANHRYLLARSPPCASASTAIVLLLLKQSN